MNTDVRRIASEWKSENGALSLFASTGAIVPGIEAEIERALAASQRPTLVSEDEPQDSRQRAEWKRDLAKLRAYVRRVGQVEG